MHYKKHLSRDESLKKILHVIDEIKLVNKKTVYEDLTASIISQQLSTKVARGGPTWARSWKTERATVNQGRRPERATVNQGRRQQGQ